MTTIPLHTAQRDAGNLNYPVAHYVTHAKCNNLQISGVWGGSPVNSIEVHETPGILASRLHTTLLRFRAIFGSANKGGNQ
jgi:hypothetical protein